MTQPPKVFPQENSVENGLKVINKDL